MSTRSASENPIRELSLALDRGIEPSLTSVSVQDDGTLAVLPLPRMVTMKCYIDDIAYTIDICPDALEETAIIKVRSEIGMLPFTIESSDRRNAVRQIVRATSDYEYGRLIINKYQQIIGLCETKIDHPPHLSDVITVLVRMKATLRPFLVLLGEFLGENPTLAIDPGKQKPASALMAPDEIAHRETAQQSADLLSMSRFSAFSIGLDEMFLDEQDN